MTLTKAAEAIGVTPATLRRAARLNQLKAEKVGPRAWMTTLEAAQAWKDNPAYHKTGPKSAD